MMDDLGRVSSALADRYAILRQLGAGGMATVYLAEDRKHRRQVAQGRRIAAGVRDTDRRRATLVGVADTATRPEVAVAVYRAFGDDDAVARLAERQRHQYGN